MKTRPRGISFSPDGKLLASCDSRGWVKLWNVENRKLIKRIPAHRNPNRWVTSVKFSPDGKILASTSNDSNIKLWQVADGSFIHILQGKEFSGVIYAHKLRVSIGDCVRDLEIIAKACNYEDFINRVEYLPL